MAVEINVHVEVVDTECGDVTLVRAGRYETVMPPRDDAEAETFDLAAFALDRLVAEAHQTARQQLIQIRDAVNA